MNNKLSSVVAAFGLMASAVLPSACSDTSLLVAPERQTLPSPEVEMTSVSARSCIARVFRALAEPEMLCPHPLEDDDISEEGATDAQDMYDQCLINVPEIESYMSAEVITLFTPFLPSDFDFSGTTPEVQERIANTNIPLTVFSNYQTPAINNDNNFRYSFASFIVTPGFIVEADLSEASEFRLMLIHNNVAFLELNSNKNPYITNVSVTSNSVFKSIPSNYLEMSQLDGSIRQSFNFWVKDHLGTSDDSVDIYGGIEAPLRYDSLTSDTAIPIAISTSIGECVENAVDLATGGEGFTMLHLE